MDIYAADDLNTKLDTLKKTFGSTTKVSWNGRVKGKKVAEGDYLLRFYAESNPAYVRDVRVTVKEGARPVIPVAETGSIMPTWDMDDAAMWDMMMKPSVVSAIRRCMTSRRRMARHWGRSTGRAKASRS